MITNSMPSNFISAYNETLIDVLKNYSDGKSFDSNCSLELVFATTETYAGKQDDFATVWNGLQNNPNLRTSDLPDKMETNYFVTLRWKDKDGKTLGGKTIQLENQAEFNSLCKQVETAGGVNEE